MKTKILIATVLVGSCLFTTSCLDDKESPSVEAVRNAKAEQLKSIAALNNAEAEATKLLAEANAALIAARTEAKQLETAKTEIEKQIKEIELEKAKLSLKLQQEGYDMELAIQMQDQENQLAALKKEADKIEYEKQILTKKFEIQSAKLETELANAQKALLIAQGQLKSALIVADQKAAERLDRIVVAYTNAVTALNSAKKSLYWAEVRQSQLEYNLLEETIDDFIAEQVKEYKESILDDSKRLAFLKEHYKYAEVENVDEWIEKRKEAKDERHLVAENKDVLKNKYNVLKTAANDELPDIWEITNESALAKAFNNLRSVDYYYFGTTGMYDSFYQTLTNDYQDYTVYKQDLADPFYFEHSVYETNGYDPNTGEWYEAGDLSPHYKYIPITFNTVKLSTFVPAFQNRIDQAQEIYDTNNEYYKEQYKLAQDETKAAKKAWDDEVAKGKDADPEQVEILANEYRQALRIEENWQRRIDYLDEYLASVKQNLADLNLLINNGTAMIELSTLLDDYNDTYFAVYKPVEEAYMSYLDANLTWVEWDEAYNFYDNLLTETDGSHFSVVELDARIKMLVNRIEETTANIDEWESVARRERIEERRQYALDLQIIEVGLRQAEVQAAQINADAAKKAMDAAFAEYED